MEQNFKDKVVLITGATSGIGSETAIAFGKAGAKVVVSGRREKEGNEVVAKIEKNGGTAIFVQADVSKEDDIKNLISATKENFGRLDCAFNNAGLDGTLAPVHEQSLENIQKVLDINVTGVLLSMKHEIPLILESGGGAIVNNSSIAGYRGMPGGSVYMASKHAVLGMTKCAALEYSAQGIRVNAVCPAAIETSMWESFTNNDEEMQKMFVSLHPIGRIGKPIEVANAVLWLCSDSASFISGVGLPVDGAFLAK